MQADVKGCTSCSPSIQNVGCRLELVTTSGNNAVTHPLSPPGDLSEAKL